MGLLPALGGEKENFSLPTAEIFTFLRVLIFKLIMLISLLPGIESSIPLISTCKFLISKLYFHAPLTLPYLFELILPSFHVVILLPRHIC